jgi:hypothetical protein
MLDIQALLHSTQKGGGFYYQSSQAFEEINSSARGYSNYSNRKHEMLTRFPVLFGAVKIDSPPVPRTYKIGY